MDAGDLRVISLERYDKVQLGYAFTTHSLQGDTREASYVLVGGSMQDRELSYVQMSRHRGEAHIYAATEEVGNSLETMADVMSRSRQKEIAQESGWLRENQCLPSFCPDVECDRSQPSPGDSAQVAREYMCRDYHWPAGADVNPA
jgi:hypothetical protein